MLPGLPGKSFAAVGFSKNLEEISTADPTF
jgi:hypothetical protein